MITLDTDIHNLIFSFLPITDKRSFLRTSTATNNLSNRMPQIESAFQKMINDTRFFCNDYYSNLHFPLYKYTTELLYDKRDIPDKYIVVENTILHRFPKLYKTLATRGEMGLVSKMLNLKRNVNENIKFVMRGAAKSGNTQFFELLHTPERRFDGRTVVAAAKAGQFETLKWLIEHDAAMDTDAVYTAIIGGHIQILKYLITTKKFLFYNAGYFAGLHGRLKIIKYMYSIDPESISSVISGAAKGGYLNIVEYALKHGNAIPTENFCCGHIHIWMWLIENQKYICDLDTIANIASTGSLECLQYVHSKGYDVRNTKVLEKAVSSRNVEMIKWLHGIGVEITKSAVDAALKRSNIKDNTGGSLEIVKLFVGWSYNLSKHNCELAALYGDLEMLQYQYSKGCKLKQALEYAAAGGHLHVIVWCRKQDCKWNASVCKEAAASNHLEVLKWLRGLDRNKWNFESDDTEICTWDDRVYFDADVRGHDDVVKFALENGCVCDGDIYV